MQNQIMPPQSGEQSTNGDEEFALIDAKTIARMCNISESMIYKQYASGRTPTPIRFGRLIRWRKKDITEWIAAGCPDAGTTTERKAQ